MIGPITAKHHAQILNLNARFEHWLSPLDQTGLDNLLARASYARQINNGAGVLIGYAHDVPVTDHKNLNWLRPRLGDFFYIDRVIIASDAQGQGLAQQLYADVARFARAAGHRHLACEVNTVPDNPGSHRFHQNFGFLPLGDEVYPAYGKSLRYYAKTLD